MYLHDRVLDDWKESAREWDDLCSRIQAHNSELLQYVKELSEPEFFMAQTEKMLDEIIEIRKKEGRWPENVNVKFGGRLLH